MIMAPPRNNHPLGLIKVAVVVILIIFSLTFLPSVSVYDKKAEREEEKSNNNKKVLGSRPPSCVNRCMNCRPCKATLVIPPHHQQSMNKIKGSNGNGNGNDNYREYYYSSPDHNNRPREDDTYYLLSWKCTCGDRLFQP